MEGCGVLVGQPRFPLAWGFRALGAGHVRSAALGWGGRQRSLFPPFWQNPSPLVRGFAALPKPFGDDIGYSECKRDSPTVIAAASFLLRRGGQAGGCRARGGVARGKVGKRADKSHRFVKNHFPSIRVIYVSTMNLVARVNVLFYETHLNGEGGKGGEKK